MSLEYKILAACIHSRDAYEQIREGLEAKVQTPISELILDLCDRYYENDAAAKHVDIDYLTERIKGLYDSDKKAQSYIEIAKEINALDVSALNVVDLILAGKRKEVGTRLALALASDSKDVPELLEAYSELGSKQAKEGENEDILHNWSAEDALGSVLNPESLIKLPTKALNEAVGGGALPGHHIVVFARPETGKTALCVSFARAFAHQQLDGIYFGNEDPIRSIAVRAQSCFSGMTGDQIKDNPAELNRRLDKTGWKHVRFIPLRPGTPFDIIKYVKRYKPKWIVVDQLRNLQVRADTRVNQLEAAATSIRNIAGKFGLVAISVTQAGDSAEGKLTLGMGDVDFSNTGIPAQADLMIGMGVNEDYEKAGMRMINLPKNKLAGIHTHFPLKLVGPISRLEDV